MKRLFKTLAKFTLLVVLLGGISFGAWLILYPIVGALAPSLISIGLVAAMCFYTGYGWRDEQIHELNKKIDAELRKLANEMNGVSE